MTLRAQWDGLSPNVQRWTMLGVAAAMLLAVAALSVQTVQTPPTAATPQQQLVRNLLTDTDPRALGVEGLATRLERMEKHVDELNQRAARAPAVTPAPAGSSAADLAHQMDIETLKSQVDALRKQLDAANDQRAAAAPASPARPPGRLADPTPTPAAAPPPRREPPLEQLFTRPERTATADLTTPTGGGRAMDIRVVSAAPRTNANGQPADAKDGVFIPAGTILRGVLLNGLDAPTGQGARTEPTPAVDRIKHDAILPNRYRADVKECFVIVGGFGDLGAERAYLRSETLTCVRRDGGVIEVPVDGYAVGEDGKVGVRGRLVSKQGAMLARAMQAGFLQSFAKMFTQVPSIPISNANNSSQVQYQTMFTPQAAASGAAGGVGGAMEKLADYYMTMAENTFPVLEVDAGRGIEIILNKGVSLRMAE